MDVKKQWKWFTIFEYEKEQEYLRKMHKAGWKLQKVSGLCLYHFEKCQPQDVVYQLDYNQEGRENREQYLKMFQDCGWEYIQDYAGYSYFRKAVAEDGVAEEIFCDAESRLQMMERVLSRRMLPLLVIFFALLLPRFFHSFSNSGSCFITVFLAVLMVIYLWVFLRSFLMYRQYKKNVKK